MRGGALWCEDQGERASMSEEAALSLECTVRVKFGRAEAGESLHRSCRSSAGACRNVIGSSPERWASLRQPHFATTNMDGGARFS